MLTYNDQTKARFPLSLDGRGARGEGVASPGKAGFLLATCLLFLAPAPAALAQNECDPLTPPSLNGATADSYTCDPADYPDGITYTSDGDLTLTVPDDTVDFTVNDAGVNVGNGNAADNLFWDSTDYTSGTISGTDGAVLDYLSADGDIDITVGGVIEGAPESSATHAIRAEATGAGNVSVTTLDRVNPRASGFGASHPIGIGIEALTTTGDIAINTSARVNAGPAGGLYAIHADSSAGGNIDINLATGGSFAARAGRGTHGILAETTGAGNIAIESEGAVSGGSSSSGAAGEKIGIEALTDTGNIAITTARAQAADGGVRAVTGGSGTITLDVSAEGHTSIQAITGTGNITIDARNLRYNGSAATGIETQTDGLTTINLRGQPFPGYNSNSGNPGAGSYAIRSSGGTAVVNLEGALPPPDEFFKSPGISGAVDFSGLSGGATVNVRSGNIWALGVSKRNPNVTNASVSFFSDVDDTVNIDAGGFLSMPFLVPGFGGDTPTVAEDTVTVQFGTGTDTLNNAGDLFVSPVSAFADDRRRGYEAELRFEELTTFNNTGTIWLGADLVVSTVSERFEQATDLWPDDILAMPGATFHGGPGSRVVLEANLNRTGQSACDTSQRDADGDLVADCINIAGGAATGRTELVLQDMTFFDRGAYNPDGTVIVDLSGSDPADTDPDAFFVGPDSDHYSPDQGGIVDKGMFFYTIAYDPDVQQFNLFGLPAPGAQQLPLLAHASNDLWRTATNSWFERRVDQRDVNLDDGLGGGFWFRTERRDADRDLGTPIVAGGETLVFDNTYSQEDTTFTFGLDLISRSAGNSAWVFGAMVGYGRAQLEYDTHENTANLEGMHAGLYGSVTFGDFYVDAAFNGGKLDIHNDVPNLNLKPEGTILSPEARFYGMQVEAGWDLLRLGMLAVEPLAGLSYVTTSIDDLTIPADDPTRFGGEVDFDDTVSSRGSLGVRLTLDGIPSFAPTSVGLTARAIEEFDGEGKASIANVGPIDAPVIDTFDGTFGQVTGDVSITNAAKTAAGYLKVDGIFGDDYDSLGVSAGFRYQW